MMRVKHNEMNFKDTRTSSKMLNTYFMNILRVLLIIPCDLKVDLIASEMQILCFFSGGLSFNLHIGICTASLDKSLMRPIVLVSFLAPQSLVLPCSQWPLGCLLWIQLALSFLHAVLVAHWGQP